MRFPLTWTLVLLSGLILNACSSPAPPVLPVTPTVPGPTSTPIHTEKIIMIKTKITAIHFEKAFFKPGEPVQWTVVLATETDQPQKVRVVAAISHLAAPVTELSQEVELCCGSQEVQFSWRPPSQAPRGYGLDVRVERPDGSMAAQASAGMDVLERWTQNPRYGFLSEFEPGRKDAAQVMQSLADVHINGLQFYDWMYRHEQFLTNDEPYIDLLGRRLSRKTVDSLIDAAHQRGIAAMPYTAIYGASIAFYKQHPDWALYRADGKPDLFGENFMAIMDPRPGTPWTTHLLAQFEDVLQRTQFDGIHLDSYGDPKIGYDINGKGFDLAQPIADTIDATHEVVDRYRKDGAVVFNCVTNWPVETAAPSREDFVYIEVWSPYTSFNDLHTLIANAQKLGKGKPVVLAAYVKPDDGANAVLMDALIFASGAGHIELGERGGYLADPYFPKYEILEPEMAAALKREYDFAVRYQDVFGPGTAEATVKFRGKVAIEGINTNLSAEKDKVAVLVREKDGLTAINLVNMLGLPHGQWNQPVPPPTRKENLKITLSGLERPVKQIWLASPDTVDLGLKPVEIQQQGDQVTFTLPELVYWDMLLVEWQ